MYAYYLQRGHSLEKLINLPYVEKYFYFEAMNHSIEEENERYEKMFGGK
ncbi:hypothetical protein EUAN_06890 [Andreesenia angusta]|uniref:Uncharacterized protein n=1 Tax=Andreesenia angusta TaxID=39480 RepID=A0A1S1V920_9FIRM|nr:hypothetical protein [Andreesenia angusta]OHW62905.1 hypothetical protein EUAN_06890 [Andreesenia angusta]